MKVQTRILCKYMARYGMPYFLECRIISFEVVGGAKVKVEAIFAEKFADIGHTHKIVYTYRNQVHIAIIAF